ncbi:MAG: PIN domain-containing protein [Novosphingobium sp.]|nr:PIN domain-containing protein [Novosphingobium sp.]
MPDSFLDTNTLIYLASGDDRKADRVESLLSDGTTVSVQVLNEIANVARRKLNWSWADTNGFLSMVKGLVEVLPLTIETHETGIDLSERYGFSVYDGQIVGAALLAECDTLWSEDMQDGLLVADRLRIRNPFADV